MCIFYRFKKMISRKTKTPRSTCFQEAIDNFNKNVHVLSLTFCMNRGLWINKIRLPKPKQNGKNHPKCKNSKTSRDMPKLAIYPSTRGLSSIGKRGFQHVLYGKISKKTIFFCAAILDHFQTKMFKSETTSFHYFSPRIPNL